MVTDKLTFTHNFLEELDRSSGKANFMPANEIGVALQYLEEKGIPNAKHEDYKYCNIEAILRKEFKTISGKEIELNDLSKKYFIRGAFNIYILNGTLAGYFEIPKNLNILSIDKTPSEILKKHLTKYAITNSDVLIALNTAYADRGFFLHVSGVSEIPVIIHHINSSEGNLFFNTRNLV